MVFSQHITLPNICFQCILLWQSILCTILFAMIVCAIVNQPLNVALQLHSTTLPCTAHSDKYRRFKSSLQDVCGWIRMIV